MAGGNKSHSLKTQKRKLQQANVARRDAAQKRAARQVRD
jgi:hypothetical protein